MSFIKEFVQKPNGEIVIKDSTKTDDYINEKVRFFSDVEKFANKEEILDLYKEILDMCDFDIANSTIDTSISNQLLGFNKNRVFVPRILLFNFSSILGAIYNKLYCLDSHKLHLVKNGSNGPVSTHDMLQSATQELNDLYYGDKPAYGATLILVTLLEENLKTSIKALIMQDALLELKNKIIKGLHLSDFDEKLYLYLLNQYFHKHNIAIKFDGVEASTRLSYELFRKYKVINSNDEIKNIFLNKITLNQLLSSKVFNEKVDDRYNNVLKNLFQINKLNLRNNLAHCGFGNINYYNFNVTMLLYGILNVALCNMCFI